MEKAILLVAYNRELVALLLRKLSEMGFNSIDLVVGKSEALEQLSKKSYALALIDLDLQSVNESIETGISIRTQYDTPFIYLGEERASGMHHQIMQTRPWALITKPVRWADLQIAIENILFRHSEDLGLIEDFNLQKDQLQKITDLERRWHTLLNNLPGLAYQCLDDEKWTMWFLSQGCRELTGYEPSDIVLNKKISFQELIHPDDRIVVRNTIEKSSHKQFELTYRIRTKQGQEKWVLERGILTDQIQNGRAILEGVIVDIDEQMRAEIDLQLSLNELKILNSLNSRANEGIPTKKIIAKLVAELNRNYGVDTNLYFLDSGGEKLVAQNSFLTNKDNSDFAQLHGYQIPNTIINLVEGSWHHSVLHGAAHYFTTDQNLIGHMIRDFETNSNLERLIQLVRDQIDIKCVLAIVLTQAEKPFGLMVLRSVEDLSEKEIQSIITVSDGISNIIARKVTEEKLIKEENKFRMLWEMAPSGIIMFDSQGYIRSVNKSFSKITGYSESAYLNKHFREIPMFPKNIADKYQSAITKVMTKGRSLPVEFQWMHKNGTLNWGEARISLIKEDRKVIGIQAILTDITFRKNSELKIKESEDLYRTVITRSPMSILLVKNGKVSFTNPVLQKVLGIKRPDQLVGTDAIEIVTPEYRTAVQERMRNLSHGKENKPEVFKMNRQDQKDVFLEFSSVPVVINGEDTSLVMGRDITEQKIAEEKLRENEKLLSSILQAAPIGIGLVKDRVFYWVNDAFVKMVGYSRKELIGQSSVILYPNANEFKRAGQVKYEQLHHESIGKVETKFRCKNGVEIDILLSSVALNENDISAGTTFTAIDITQRNLSERVLKENEERYRTLFENMAQGVFYQAADGTLLNVNRAALGMLGLTKSQFIGQTSISPQWLCVDEEMTELPGEEHPSMVSLRTGNKIKDEVIGVFNPRLKKHVWLLVNTQPQFRPGESDPYQVFVTLHDLTDIKNAEIELNKSYLEIKKLSRHTEEIREEERKQIARNLHDELGQILTAVKMDVSWIKNKLRESDQVLVRKADETLEIIDHAIGGVQRITSELRPPILDNLGLFEALRSLVIDFQRRTGIKTNIQLPEKENPLNPDFMISLYRIIQETLTNVIRHAQAGHIGLKVAEKKNTLEIQIKDNGRGIPEEKIHSSDSLGLIGIKERVLRWNGEFSIYGNPGDGTNLRIAFPLSTINRS